MPTKPYHWILDTPIERAVLLTLLKEHPGSEKIVDVFSECSRLRVTVQGYDWESNELAQDVALDSLLKEVSDRCRWEEVWSEDVPRVLLEKERPTEAIKLAMSMLQAPSLIVLRWDQAMWFLQEQGRIFSELENPDERDYWMAYKHELFESGYLGIFQGLKVVATMHAFAGFVTNAGTPGEVQLFGPPFNAVLLETP